MPVFNIDEMRKIILPFLILYALQLIGQSKHDYQWVLDRFVLMDFREDSLQLSILSNTTDYGSGDRSTSICDDEGVLLFYSGGCFIINAEHEIMENGDSINSDYAYSGFCYDGDYPFPQSNTIIPFPQDGQKYIYFNLDIHIIEGTLPSPLNLYYHIVDMDMGGGLGAVTEIKQVAVNDTLSRGYVQAVRHANGVDWWVVAAELNSNCYYVIPVTSNGVGLPEKQCLGGVWDLQDGGGQAVFSPDGTRYARVEAVNGWYLFDFDASTGQLSDPVQLMGTEAENYFRGAAFSPDSRYLYVSARMDLFQFDLQAADIQGSIQLVGQLDPDDAFPGVGTLALQKLAPDGKIYIASPGSHKYLSVINRPNCPGTLCDFQPWSLELPESNYAGLPNLPHFSIPESDTECDSLVSVTYPTENETFKVYPNPASDKITVQADGNARQYCISNMLGMTLAQGKINQKISEIDISSLNNGIHFVSIENREGKVIGVEKILVQKN
jgi:Secretion system C-terminal sorting domain